jgi:hypothetical protein
MARNTTVEVDGSIRDEGKLSGRGTLVLRFADPASARFGLDYSDPDRLTLTVSARSELRIRKDKTLTLSGNLGKDFLKGTLDGGVTLTFEIPKTARVELDHRFDARGRTTTLRLTGSF